MSDPDPWPTEGPTVVGEPAAPPYDTAVLPPVPPGSPLPPPGEGPDDRFGMGLLVGILAIAAVGAVIAAILLTRRHNHPAAQATTTVVVTKNATPTTSTARTTTVAATAAPVPDLIGESTADATSSLKASGFTVRVAIVRGTPPAGRVVGESPPPARKAASGSVVTLDISNGAAVPPKVAQPKAPATKTTVVTQTTTTPAAKTVPSTTTAAAATSTAATSTASQTTTATPPPTSATVPDVSGDDAQSAAQTLSRANLSTSLAYVPSTDPLETVEAESPTAGATAPAGSHVTVNVSSGPGQKQQETVPDATGKTIPQAVAAMQQAGLRLIFVKKAVNERSLAGTVVEQTPAPGKTAPKNAQILVYMGAFK